jgi:DNA mismatch repair protein MutS2
MDQRSIRVLEYEKIIDQLCQETSCGLGLSLTRELRPSFDFNTVIKWQKATSEMKLLMRLLPELGMGGVKDIRSHLKKVSIGMKLEPIELIDTADTLAAGRLLKKSISSAVGDFACINEFADTIGLFQEIENQIYHSINDFGEVKDNATPQLNKLRNQIRTQNERIKDKLDSYIRSAEYQKIIQEAIVTQRDGRYVIPVRQESRGAFPGIIHDQSASGATLFIEPMSVVEMNNDLRQLKKQEMSEVDRILQHLTNLLKDRMAAIEFTIDALSHLDFIMAKARLSFKMDAYEPEIAEKPIVRFKQARHPLLSGSVVPIDIEVGETFNTLVITGPNTGGKTVALKTVGLLVLMSQSGLHIPAKYGSCVGVFNEVLSDIGDEQSIEQNLSTFSGHMKNIIDILKQAGRNSLVLLDEVGAGTDPIEGAALAMTILDHLHRSNVKTIATTHYSELKAFAFNHDGIENGSVEFDAETLRPTYRLIIGLPGHSNAFAIANRLGLPLELIRDAQNRVATEDVRVDDMIRKITVMKAKLENEIEYIESKRLEIEKMFKEQREAHTALLAREKEIILKAKADANTMLTRVRRESDEIARQLKREQKERSDTYLDNADLTKARGALRSLQKDVSEFMGEFDLQPVYEPLKEGKIGASVFVRNLDQSGVIVGKRGNMFEVQIGSMKVTTDLKELFSDSSQPSKNEHASLKNSQSDDFLEGVNVTPTELDIRGLTIEDATEKLEIFLDRAMLTGINRIRIIHGKGTGVLRTAIRKYLAEMPCVKEYRFGESGEGGDGVTIVSL